MGDIADQMINGDICEMCCCAKGEGLGFPFTCADCKAEEPINPDKVECPQCGKYVKSVGLGQHIAAMH